MSNNFTDLLQPNPLNTIDKTIEKILSNSSGIFSGIISNSFHQFVKNQKSIATEIINQMHVDNSKIINSVLLTNPSIIRSAQQSFEINSIKSPLELASSFLSFLPKTTITNLTTISSINIENIKHVFENLFPQASNLLTLGISSVLKDLKFNSISDLSTSSFLKNTTKISFAELLEPAINSYYESVKSDLSRFSTNIDSDVILQYQDIVSNFIEVENDSIKIDNEILDELFQSEILELTNNPNFQSLTENDLKIINEIDISNTFIDENFDINTFVINKGLSDSFKSYWLDTKNKLGKFILKFFIIFFGILGKTSDIITVTEYFNKQTLHSTMKSEELISLKYNYFVCSTQAVIRTEANKGSSIICHIYKDTKLTIKDSINNWVLVEFFHFVNDKEIVQSGWISRRNIKKIKDFASLESLEKSQ